MDVRFSKRFVKQYNKLSPRYRRKFDARLLLWQEQPYHPLLNHHELGGKMAGLHSINVSGGIRALYRITDNTIYIYELIGTHSQLYG